MGMADTLNPIKKTISYTNISNVTNMTDADCWQLYILIVASSRVRTAQNPYGVVLP